MRTLLGFAVAMFIVPVLIALVGAILYLSDPQQGRNLIVFSTWVLTFTVPVTIVVGLPAWNIFHERGWCRLAAYASGGAVIGLLSSLFLFVFTPLKFDAPVALLAFAGAGALSASAFWFVAERSSSNSSLHTDAPKAARP